MPDPSTADTGRLRGVLGTLPAAAAVLVLINAMYITLVAIGNITDFHTNLAFVQHVMSMDTTNFGQPAGAGLDQDVMWRAIDDSTLWHIGYAAIIAAEALAAVVLIVGLVHFARALFGSASYDRARRWSSAGLTLIVLIFGGGFIAIGGEWFQMWRSTTWNGLDSALRYVVLAGLGLVLLHLPDRAWGQPLAISTNRE
ncbi:DUF2165 domain-containing protein [Tsukamurella strandjordii]|uniref:DUF2165 domain-containing protein n=1 Tax=Tsukamurella strandjordii TaxID=147577 RepID=A0AA90NFX1_9ACTN|nr:DUF2165 domain-containing protein [Tsukamurella strandjordii]MDP0399687.1 DUF2165 domain-containing protein [Tsukamurella strandjordii]